MPTPSSHASVDRPSLLAQNQMLANVILAGLLLMAGANFELSHQLEIQHRDELTAFVAKEKSMDELFLPYIGQGNIWLNYQGFADDMSLEDRWTLLKWYTRSVYTLYPARLYVADENTVVPKGFSGNPIPSFWPAPAWLAEHQIKIKLTLLSVPGDIDMYYKKL